MGGHEFEIGTVAGHGEDEVVLDVDFAIRCLNDDIVLANFFDGAVEVGFDFTALNAIFDVGLDPIFDVRVNARAADDHGDARAGPKEFERADGG